MTDIIRISYDNGKQTEENTCSFSKIDPKDTHNLNGYCNHYEREGKPRLSCNYGLSLSETSVPAECPLREKPTTKTIELLIK